MKTIYSYATKTLALATLSIVLTLTTQAQNNVGIGTTTPHPKAILELQAIDKGVLVPRLTAVQMNAITTPPNGLLVYNTTENCFNYYNSTITNWKSMCATTGIANSGDTVIINLLKVDSLFVHYLKADSAFITNLFSTYIKADSAYIKLLRADSIFTNYLYANTIKADTIIGGFGKFDSLYVGGQNILQTISDSIAAQAWLLKGNNANATNQLGTLNARNLNIITNNSVRISVMSGTGNVGIGQTLPTEKLDVIGNIKTTGSVEFGNDLKPAGLSGTIGDLLISQGAGVAPTWVPQITIVPTTTNTLTNPTNTITSTVNGVTATAPAVNTVSNSLAGTNLTTTVNGVAGAPVNLSTIVPATTNTLASAGNTITSTVNGVTATAPAVNTVSNTYNTTTGDLSTTVNGVTGANVVIPAAQNITDSIKAQAWLLKGNASTTAGANFVGTTDAQDLVLKTRGIENMRILNTNGNVGIGTVAPSTILDVFATGPRNAIRETVDGGYSGMEAYSYRAGSIIAHPYFMGLAANGTKGGATYPLFDHPLSAYIGRDAIDGNSGGNYGGASMYFFTTEDYTITNKGTKIEFRTTPNSSNSTDLPRMTIDHNGNVGIGTKTPNTILDIFASGANNAIRGTVEGGYSGIEAFTYRNGAVINYHPYFIGNYARGSKTSPAYPLAGDVLSAYIGRAAIDGGNANYGGASMYFFTTEDYTTNNKGTKIEFRTTPNSSNSTDLPRMTIDHNGKVGIGTAAPTEKLHVIGNILASGSITPSDARYKQNINTLQEALTNVLKLRGVSYEMKAEHKEKGFGTGTQVGVIAQEVEAVYPQLINTSSDGYKGVDYSKFTPILIEAIKELNAKHEAALQAQQAQIELLKKQVELLQKK